MGFFPSFVIFEQSFSASHRSNSHHYRVWPLEILLYKQKKSFFCSIPFPHSIRGYIYTRSLIFAGEKKTYTSTISQKLFVFLHLRFSEWKNNRRRRRGKKLFRSFPRRFFCWFFIFRCLVNDGFLLINTFYVTTHLSTFLTMLIGKNLA